MTYAAAGTPIASISQKVEASARNYVLKFWAVVLVIFTYLAFCWVHFDISSIKEKWRPDRGMLFILDSYAYKDHVTMRWKHPDDLAVTFEGSRWHTYDPKPHWFLKSDEAVGAITFANGNVTTIYQDEVVYEHEEENKVYRFRIGEDKKPYVVGFENNLEELPDWIRQTKSKIEIRPSLYERIQVGKNKVEVHRYEIGWKYFWFDFHSPLANTSIWQAIPLAFSSERVDPLLSNASLIFHEIKDNEHWQHGIILYAMLETIFMALLGTMIASLVGLPIAFLAARNVQPVLAFRFVLRRSFDLLRGIDTLLWSLIFLRAFGPGLFTGIFAIAFTDTGTLGKLMSEAIENADDKQREGIQSTGSSKIQQHRFGIIPQIMPVFISQSLYYLESNTRSAVIIGAMGAGGIGLQFLGALQTGSDFENVAYMALLVLTTVICMDSLSARLRRMLIGFQKHGN